MTPEEVALRDAVAAVLREGGDADAVLEAIEAAGWTLSYTVPPVHAEPPSLEAIDSFYVDRDGEDQPETHFVIGGWKVVREQSDSIEIAPMRDE